ncbi:MAG TPA: hypothetical protein VLE91_03905 [Candidatus Saccharimonadales bacterium]|nr:hypothetical protein [Candidatus Saccharimonadales bacterium]
MTAERNEVLPQGYYWQPLSPSGFSIPRPEGWYFRQRRVRALQESYFISREETSGIGVVQIGSGPMIAPKGKEGFFQTGVSAYFFQRVREQFGTKPSNVAQRRIVNLTGGFISDGPVERDEKGEYIIYRRYMKKETTEIVNLKSRPLNMYSELVACDKNDILLLVAFETPSELWAQDKQIADVMVKNLLFA